jgi:hypothetical protein
LRGNKWREDGTATNDRTGWMEKNDRKRMDGEEGDDKERDGSTHSHSCLRMSFSLCFSISFSKDSLSSLVNLSKN